MADDERSYEAPRDLSELPNASVDPNELPPGECPWQRYQRAPHDSWAYRWGDSVIVRELATAKAILSDDRFEQGIRVAMEQNPQLDPRFVARRKQGLLLRDGPDHKRMRRIALKSAFTPRAVERHRSTMRSIMSQLADRVPSDGHCDGVATLTHEYPTRVISHVLGAPETDVEMFSALVETILNAQGGDPEVVDVALAAHEELDTYMVDLIEQKHRRPGADLLTDLVRAETEDGTLSNDEVLNIAVSVIMAGTDTTRNQLAIGLHLFADHPDQWAALEDEARLTTAVDELLRIAPIGHVLLRVPRHDLTINDLELTKGTMVVLDIGAAHRDPSVIDAPDEFDISRPGPSNHLGFGHGHKYCLGASLAKAELVEGLRVLRQRFATIEHAAPSTWRRVGFVQGPLTLPIRLGTSSADR